MSASGPSGPLVYLYLGVKVTQNVAQYPLHHVTYAPAKFEVVMSVTLLCVGTFFQ